MQAMTGLSALRGVVTVLGGGSSFQDTFDRADQEGLGTSSDGTRTWVIDPPLETEYAPGYALGWEVRSNRAGINFLTGPFQGAYATELGTAGRAKITLADLPPPGFPYYVLGRVLDRDNHIRVEIANEAPTTVLMQKVVGGSVSNIGLLATTSVSAGDTLELEITSGNDIRVYRNGSQVGTTENNDTHSTRRGWGMAVHGAGGELSAWGGSIERFDFVAE